MLQPSAYGSAQLKVQTTIKGDCSIRMFDLYVREVDKSLLSPSFEAPLYIIKVAVWHFYPMISVLMLTH